MSRLASTHSGGGIGAALTFLRGGERTAPPAMLSVTSSSNVRSAASRPTTPDPDAWSGKPVQVRVRFDAGPSLRDGLPLCARATHAPADPPVFGLRPRTGIDHADHVRLAVMSDPACPRNCEFW